MRKEIEEVTPSISAERRQEIIAGLARQLLEQDSGLFVQAIAVTYYHAIHAQARNPLIREKITAAGKKRKKSRHLLIPISDAFIEYTDAWYDQDYLHASRLSTASNLLVSPLFWDLNEGVDAVKSLDEEERLYEEWLLKQWCGLQQEDELTAEHLIEKMISGAVFGSAVDIEKLQSQVKKRFSQGDRSITMLVRAAFKAGAEDVLFPSLEESVADGTISERDVLIFLAFKLETSKQLFFAKAEQLGFSTQSTEDKRALGRSLFGETQPFAWWPKPADIWPLLIELLDDIQYRLWIDWLPGWRDTNGIFTGEATTLTPDLSGKIAALLETWPD